MAEDLFGITDEIKQVFNNAYLKKPENLQIGISALKKHGCSKVASIYILLSELNIPLNQAHNLVQNSEAWNAN